MGNIHHSCCGSKGRFDEEDKGKKGEYGVNDSREPERKQRHLEDGMASVNWDVLEKLSDENQRKSGSWNGSDISSPKTKKRRPREMKNKLQEKVKKKKQY